MNERIKELMEKASSNACYDEPKSITLYNKEIEAFAELIVLECAKSANDWYQNHDRIHSDPMSYVLAHFGVEE